MGGTRGVGILKPDILQLSYFESINGIASVFLTVAGIIGLAFIYGNKGKATRYVLLFLALAGCSLSASHGIFGILYRILQMSGRIGLESGTFTLREDTYVLWDLVLFEPWFLVEGLLLGLVGWYFLKEARSRKIWLAACLLGVGIGLVTGLMGVRFA
ncbi:DUF3995 domain-containing protein [Paenibacillus aurantius]|uniref:DUF3995 domain-containing protein n=2 Tax=Paenibacillus aurantius TaxID=2918900 RepID=A0AA96LIV9_9BACL|nr:DUF3995 domain-containing protein [Paenibacillus aurantius]WNQ14179.1 DUF3995 domain-containing protein [Paenibacillus aurantius]